MCEPDPLVSTVRPGLQALCSFAGLYLRLYVRGRAVPLYIPGRKQTQVDVSGTVLMASWTVLHH